MHVYQCKRCGSKHDFAGKGEDRRCDRCGALLVYRGRERSPWGPRPMRDYDAIPSAPQWWRMRRVRLIA